MKISVATIKKAAQVIYGVLMRNLGWKILSLFIAVLLWSYVISNDSSITRDVSLSGVDVIISGQSVLQGRELALLTDAASELADVRVRVRAPQSDYARVTADSVNVELDLTRIRQTGTQLVTLTGSSAYGDVVQIIPATIELDVEELDQRTVPVNVYLQESEDAAYWYTMTQKNPAMISVSGPSSIVQQVSSALVNMDLSAVSASVIRAEQYILLDNSGNEITFPLTRSTTTVNVGVDVYPKKQLTISSAPETCTTGSLPEGYAIAGIEISPSVVTVAAESDLIDALNTIAINPVDITDARQSFSAVTTLSGLTGAKYVSNGEVTVMVYIQEIESTVRFDGIGVTVRAPSASTEYELGDTQVGVKVTGPYSALDGLSKDDIIAYVDLTGLESGQHELPVQVEVDNRPDLTFEVYPEYASVTVK